MTPEFDAACTIVGKVPVSGQCVLAHASARDARGRAILSPGERYRYIIRAARHFVAQAGMGDIYTALPVDIQTFVESPRFLNRRGIVYPAVMKELIELNCGEYVEAVFTGGIGSGKTTAALLTMAYQVYLLSCMESPHRVFEQDPAAELLTVFQSLSAKVAKENDYKRFRNMIASSPYFTECFAFDRSLESEMVFPRRIIVRSLSGGANAAIGANVLNALLDEVNFMAIVENSANSPNGGAFNQAVEMYNGIARRRKSRFMTAKRLPGMICLVSSKRYPGEFTDTKIAEAQAERQRQGFTRIFIYDKTVYDVKPAGTYSGASFDLFLGDLSRKPRILDNGEPVPAADRHLVKAVPQEFRTEFEHDILSAIRDIAGHSTFALHPYMINTDAVAQAFGRRPSILSLGETDFVTTRPKIFPHLFTNPDEPRMAHVDLAISGDSAGVAIGHVDRFVEVKRSDNTSEMMPHVCFDAVLRVRPPRNGEIEFESIRRLFYRVKELGLNLKWISFDTFQSRDSIQLLRQKGFLTGSQSIDVDSTPYDVTKTALYDGRISAPAHDHAKTEFIRLERDPQKGTIDHPAGFSKDCSDAMAGVVFGLTYRRETWHRFGIPMQGMLSKLAAKVADKDKKSQEARQAGLQRHVIDMDVGDMDVGLTREARL
jgi:hypothetical protein